MKHNTVPRTPFSTPLSGSARETELRLRAIFSGPKKRPPVLFLALMFSACLLCGNLVSCQMAEPDVPAQLNNSQPGDISVPEPEDLPKVRAVPIDPDYPPQSEEEEWLLQALFESADTEGPSPFQDPKARLLSIIQEGDKILGAAFVEDHLENTLIVGLMDKNTHELDHGVFRAAYHAGEVQTVTFRNDDGQFCLLYTITGWENGQRDGEAGVVCLENGKLTWTWPVEGDVRFGIAPPDGPVGVFSEYQEYWYHHLAELTGDGLDLYEVDPEFQWGQDEPASMWRLTDSLFLPL